VLCSHDIFSGCGMFFCYCSVMTLFFFVALCYGAAIFVAALFVVFDAAALSCHSIGFCCFCCFGIVPAAKGFLSPLF